jgi:hypothetical protein
MPGRRFQLLAILDETHDGTWSSQELAKICGIASSTVHHILTRLEKFDLVKGFPSKSIIGFHRTLRSGAVLSGKMPNMSYHWTITPKGQQRVAYVGGHKKWCPLCAKG